MKNTNNENNRYKDTRKRWARENAELFLNTLTKVGQEIGAELTPMKYVRAYQLCIDKYEFGYPTEYKIAELISTEETYEQTLAIMTALMKRFRLSFWREWKKCESRKKAKKGKQAA